MSLIVSDDLMRRCERARVAGYSLRYNAVRRGDSPPEGLALKMFGEAWAFQWGEFNRVMGLSPEEAGELDDIITWYRDVGREPVFDLLPTDDNGPLFGALATRGFYQKRCQGILAMEPKSTSVGEVLPGVTVERVTDDTYPLFVRTYMNGHQWEGTAGEMADWERWLTHQYSGEHWRLFMALVDGEPSGAGTLALVGGGAAVLTNASTHPKNRGRGCHRKLLQHRLACAAVEGMDLVVSDTTVGSGSQRNMQRAGMVLACHLVQWHKLDGSPPA